MLAVMEQMSEFDDLKSEISNLKSKAESISRQLRAWTSNLQNSDISGQRYLNDKDKSVYKAQKRADDFMQGLTVEKDVSSFFVRGSKENNERKSESEI